MLQSLMSISINGPAVGSPECEVLIKKCVEVWNAQKKRRKLPAASASNSTYAEDFSVPLSFVEVADAAVQVSGPMDVIVDTVDVATANFDLTAEETEEVQAEVEDEVEAASAILNLDHYQTETYGIYTNDYENSSDSDSD